MRFLIIDDEQLSGMSICNVVDHLGHESRFCLDPAEYFNTLKSWKPDAVIIDLIMPQMDGLEVAERTHSVSPRVRMVLVSGLGRKTLNDAAKTLISKGANLSGVLEKPFTILEVKRVLGQISPPATS